GQGRTVDFRNAVLTMTSNLGSQVIQELTAAGRDFDSVRDAVMEVLRRDFRPEFLNRVDDVIVFRPLSSDQLTRIVDIQLESLRKRLADRKITLEVTNAARQLLAERGWDPVYGARPLKRAIQRLVQDPLAMQLLAGEFAQGDSVKVDVADDELVFRKVLAAVPAGVGG
nr:AAA family ATPase [Candidatus Dormibacteraeota bacterium]